MIQTKLPLGFLKTAVHANAVVGTIFFILALVLVMKREPLAGCLFMVSLAAIAFFDADVIWKAVRLMSGEEYLRAELRKSELRKQLAELRTQVSAIEARVQPPAPAEEPVMVTSATTEPISLGEIEKQSRNWSAGQRDERGA